MSDEHRDLVEEVALGDRLHQSRVAAGFTQRDLSDASGISIRAIRDIESGKVRHPRPDTMRMLTEGLGFTTVEPRPLPVTSETDWVESPVGDRGYPLPPPVALGPLIARDAESTALRRLLEARDNRLVAVSGLAGSGKSRLALDVAQDLHEEDGLPVLWVSPSDHACRRAPESGYLIPPEQSDVVGPWVLAALQRSQSQIEALIEFLADRPAVLVLDGVDIDDRFVHGLYRLLARCRNLRVLCTVRPNEAVRLTGDRVFPLVPLDVGSAPGADPGTVLPAAEIIRWHMAHLLPHRDTTNDESAPLNELAWWLDGWPLALVNAAAWTVVIPPTRLVALAAEDPFAVAVPPAEPETVRRLPDLLHEAVVDLDSLPRTILQLMLRRRRRWTIRDAAEQASVSSGEAAAATHCLVLNGFVRRVSEGFQTLNLFRHFEVARRRPGIVHSVSRAPRGVPAGPVEDEPEPVGL